MSMANWTTKLICGARNELLIHEIYAERGMVCSLNDVVAWPGPDQLANWRFATSLEFCGQFIIS